MEQIELEAEDMEIDCLVCNTCYRTNAILAFFQPKKCGIATVLIHSIRLRVMLIELSPHYA